MRNLVVLLVALLLAIMPQVALAGGSANLNAGAERVAMLAYVAKAENLTCIFHNPAGLAQLKGNNFHSSLNLGYISAGFRLREFDEEGNPYLLDEIKPKIAGGILPLLGVSSDFDTERWVFGVGLYFPFLGGAYFEEDDDFKYHLVRATIINAYLTPTVAYRVLDNLFVGAGISYIFSYKSGERWMEKYGFDGPLEFELTGHSWGWDVGALYNPIEKLRLGVSFASKNYLDLEGDATFTNVATKTKFDLNLKNTEIIPSTLRGGINYQLTDKVQVGFDYTWWNYSVVKKSVIEVSGDLPLGKIESPRNYRDSLNVALGMEYAYSPIWTFYGGIMRDVTPTPDATYSMETITNDYIAIAMGFKRKFERSDFTLAYQHQWQEKRNISHSILDPPFNVKVETAMFDTIVVEYNLRF